MLQDWKGFKTSLCMRQRQMDGNGIDSHSSKEEWASFITKGFSCMTPQDLFIELCMMEERKTDNRIHVAVT